MKKKASKKIQKTGNIQKQPKYDLKAKVKELQERDMRLTQEIDRLSTTVATLNNFVGQIYQALQEKKLMPYDPISKVIVPQANVKATKTEKGSDKLKHLQEQPRNFQSLFAGHGTPKTWHGRAMRNETTLGYLAEDGSLTVDPKKIAHFASTDDVKMAIAKAKMPEGERVKIEIEPE